MRLIESKFRLRTLLLSNNNIYDLAASEIYSALQFNPYLTRLKLDLNPIRNLITKDIDALTLLNSQKVSSQELPKLTLQVKSLQKNLAESLFDCAFEPALRDVVIKPLPEQAASLLQKTTAR